MSQIHVLGLGNLGRLYAHALATAPNPSPITLLLHRESLLKEWEQAGQKIEIEGASKVLPEIPSSSSGYDIEVIDSSSSKKQKPIQHLIIATKAAATVKALGLVAHRLNHNSTILFAQNGLGTVKEVTNEHFHDSQSRPSYLAAITSHGVYSKGPFHSVFAGRANITIGHVSLSKPGPSSMAAEYLLNKITSAPLLYAKAVSPKELKILRLQKLVINAMINPLTVIFRRRNGDLFNHEPIHKLMRILLSEISQFFQDMHKIGSYIDFSDEEIEEYFSLDSLMNSVLSVAEKTAENRSSMLQDVEAGRETEIDYINGWFIRQVRELGLDDSDRNYEKPNYHGHLHCNAHLVHMVKSGEIIGEDDIRQEFSLEW